MWTREDIITFFVYLDCGYQQKYSFSLTVITRILEKLYLWAWQCVKYYKRHSDNDPHSTRILKIPCVHRIWTSDLCFSKIHIQTRIQRIPQFPETICIPVRRMSPCPSWPVFVMAEWWTFNAPEIILLSRLDYINCNPYPALTLRLNASSLIRADILSPK